MIGKVIPKFLEKRWMPGIIITSFLFTGAWGYLVYTGDITTIWPLFGMSNQLLASSALIIGTIMLIRMGKVKYSWITAVPGIIMAFTTLYAGYLNITINYLPKGEYLLAVLSVIIMALVAIVLALAVRRSYDLMQIRQPLIDRYGDYVMQEVME